MREIEDAGRSFLPFPFSLFYIAWDLNPIELLFIRDSMDRMEYVVHLGMDLWRQREMLRLHT